MRSGNELRSWRLTPPGQAAAGGALVLYVTGVGLGYAELIVIAVALALLVVVALAWTWRQPRLEAERELTPPVVVRGDPAEARLTFVNPGRRATPPLFVSEQVGTRSVDAVLPRTSAGSSSRVSLPLPTDRRGVIEVGPLAVVRQDPWGLTRSARQLGATEALWVYPRIYGVASLSSGQRRDLEGPTHDGASGSITFHALREYVTGDDLRLVHWRSTARTGTIMVRQQADPSQPETTIVLDTRRGAYEGEAFEAAVDAVASLVVASTSRRFPVRLLTGEEVMASGHGSGRRRAAGGTPAASGLMQHLTRVQPTEDGSLADAGRRLATQAGGNGLVIVTGRAAPEDVAALGAIRGRYLTMAFVRFLPDSRPGVAWDRGLVNVVAPDAATFARLWNEHT